MMIGTLGGYLPGIDGLYTTVRPVTSSVHRPPNGYPTDILGSPMDSERCPYKPRSHICRVSAVDLHFRI